MGVPVVTKLGSSLSTRIGDAIMSAIDMTDWIARDDGEYVDIALRSAWKLEAALKCRSCRNTGSRHLST